MQALCNHCLQPLGVTVVYDHGLRFHPDCYPKHVREMLKGEPGLKELLKRLRERKE
jgi:hypothetical protein